MATPKSEPAKNPPLAAGVLPAEKMGGPSKEVPSPGRVVWFYDREEVVEAKRAEREPEPIVCLVRRVRKPTESEEPPAAEPAELVDLVAFTDFGPRNYDGVPRAPHGTPGAWAWPRRS